MARVLQVVLFVGTVVLIAEAQYFFITHVSSGLVLDAAERNVKLQNKTKSSSQLWTQECISEGRFYIVNKKNGTVLDVEAFRKEGDVITFPKKPKVENNQIWFINYDGSIVSPLYNQALNVNNGNCVKDEKLTAIPKNNNNNQKFKIVNDGST